MNEEKILFKSTLTSSTKDLNEAVTYILSVEIGDEEVLSNHKSKIIL